VPQVWLNYDELAEFLDCAVEEARHTGIDQEWPRQNGFDNTTRFQLPAKAALTYVLRNAQASALPRDAALLEQALGEVEELKEQLSMARGTIVELQNQIAAAADGNAEVQLSILRDLAETMREAGVPQRAKHRSVA
jgi:hypothetical protein